MRIAVTYEDGNVFGHFGHTEQFKIYDVEDEEILSAEIIGSDGNGHEALADLLNSNAIDVVLCAATGGARDVFGLGDSGANGLEDVVGDRDFCHGVFGEGDSNGVADAVDQQSADTGSALEAALVAIAGLGNAKMDGIVHSQRLHLFDQEPSALHHELDVGGFHGED